MTEKEESELALFENYKDGSIVRWDILFASFCNKTLACIANCKESVRMISVVYNDFILIRAIETLTSVFLILFLYSGNEQLTIDHIEKGSYLYVEFLGQIAQEGNMFLGLSSRDASLFLLKKTLYEIPQEVRGSWESPTNEFTLNIKCLEKMCAINKKLLIKSISCKNENGNSLMESIMREGVYNKFVDVASKNIVNTDLEALSQRTALLDCILDEIPAHITILQENHIISLLIICCKNLNCNGSKTVNERELKTLLFNNSLWNITKKQLKSLFSNP